MLNGHVKCFDDAKGYGFVAQDDDEYVFVHYIAISGEGYRSLAEGSGVEFEIEPSPKGPRAVNVVVVKAAEQQEGGAVW